MTKIIFYVSSVSGLKGIRKRSINKTIVFLNVSKDLRLAEG